MNFTYSLLTWYKHNYRDLPWKHTSDPYKIWLSEIIMQQTRVGQGMPYYERFVARFPSISDLAAASVDEVLKLWQGLGYYSRARNLHHAAQQVMNDFGGKFPSTNKELLKLKGVGTYTAAAIASFAFKEPLAALDGNGYRILTRYFGVESPIDTAACKQQLAALAQELIPRHESDAFNQALMDFGSAVCTPQKPVCNQCPLQTDCIAFYKGLTAILPMKSKRTAVRERYFNYLLIRYGKYTYLKKREAKDIWQGLYEFPLIETKALLAKQGLFKGEEWKRLTTKTEPTVLYCSPILKHQLTHQTIWATFYVVQLSKAIPAYLKNNYLQINIKDIDNYAFPQLIARVLQGDDIESFF